jgi:hypothetical protein
MGAASGEDPPEEGKDTQKEPGAEAHRGRAAAGPVGDTARSPGVEARQVRVAASPGEGGAGSENVADAKKKGHEAVRTRGAPGKGATATSDGEEQPSGRVRHEKGGGVVDAVAVTDGVSGLVGEAEAVVEAETVAVTDGVGLQEGGAVSPGRLHEVGHGQGAHVAMERAPIAADHVPAGQGVAFTEESGQ